MSISGKHLVVLVSMCGLIASSVGLITNMNGLFFVPIAEEFAILKGEASLIHTISVTSLALGGLISPRILSERTIRPLIVTATLIMVASTVATSLCGGIVPIYALSVVRGLAAGCLGFVFVTMVLNRWFVTSIGLATSIAMGCSGVSGALFSPLLSHVIATVGWRAGFVVIAALTALLNLPAILLLPSYDPATKGLRALGAPDEPKTKASAATASDQRQRTPINPLVFAAVIAFAFLASGLTALPQHFPGMAQAYALDVAAGAAMLSVCMVVNTVGKVALGALVDRFGVRISVLAYAVLVAAGLVLLFVARQPHALMIASALFGCCYGLAAVGNSMMTRDAFGIENYGRTYPYVSLTGSFANATMSSVVGFMYDFSGGYGSTIVLFGAMLAALTGLMLFVYARRNRAFVA